MGWLGKMSSIEKRRLKVLFASHGADLGGAERCLLPWASGLDRDRFDPVVVVPRGGPLVGLLQKNGVAVRQSPFRLWAAYNTGTPAKCHLFRKDFSVRAQRLADLIDREQADVVISNSMALLEGAYASRIAGRPHIWNVLEILSKDPGHVPLMPLELVYSWLPQLTDALVAVSAAVAEEFERFLPADRIHTIHTGIHPPKVSAAPMDVRTEFGWTADTPLVQFVGILSERKGVRTLIGAVPLILKSFPETRFLLAGIDGGMKAFLESEIARLNLGSFVKLLGQRKDIGRLVSECSTFVLPSNADPLPVAVLEAMALGKPVVATNSGGCSEMVEPGTTGLLVPPQSPEELAKAIVTVLADSDLAKRMGEQGRQRFQNMFSLQQYISKFEDLIQEMASLKNTTVNADRRSAPVPEFPPFDASLTTRLQATLQRTRERYHEIRNSIRLRISSLKEGR